MPEYLAPGVYIEEVEIGAKPIEGVSTSTVGFVGFAERGPLNRPTLVTSFAEYQRIFGGYLTENPEYNNVRWLPYAVDGFFSNGGKRAYIVRVAGTGAMASSGFIPDVSNFTARLIVDTAKENSSLGVKVDNLAGLMQGDILFLTDGASSECIILKSITPAKFLRLKSKLIGTYKESDEINRLEPTTPVYPVKSVSENRLEIIVDGDPGFDSKDLILFSDNNPELCDVKSVENLATTPSTTKITLKTELKNQHTGNGNIRKFSSPDPPVKVKILKSVNTGEEVIPIPLDENINFNAYDALKIGEENLLIESAESGSLLFYKGNLQYQHSKGTEIKKLAIQVTASSKGSWGNYIKVIVKNSSLSKPKITNGNLVEKSITLSTVNDIERGTILKIEVNGEKPLFKVVEKVIKERKEVVLDSTINGVALGDLLKDTTNVSTVEFDLEVIFKDHEEEVFKHLSMSSYHSRYIKNIISEDSSRFVKIENTSISKILTEKCPKITEGKEPGWLLEGGEDGTPTQVEPIDEIYAGKDKDKDIPEERKGIYALKNKEDISIVAVPGIATQTVQDKIITLCEELKDRFAVLDPYEDTDSENVQVQRNLYDSKYAALYYPWIQVYDPVTKKQINVPPSGHICGVYARSDNERGVHKAPANEKINGALGLEKTDSGDARIITKGLQEVLNPKGINCIIPFPGRGIRVWGARTISSEPLWKYINIRRLFIYVEKSIENATQWVVFEPNNERLWARVKQTITQFLTGIWREGALMGTTPEEAFFVKCDRTTMTQDDIDNGRLIIQIGIAPVKPAEFVIFRIAQWAGGSAATE